MGWAQASLAQAASQSRVIYTDWLQLSRFAIVTWFWPLVDSKARFPVKHKQKVKCSSSQLRWSQSFWRDYFPPFNWFFISCNISFPCLCVCCLCVSHAHAQTHKRTHSSSLSNILVAAVWKLCGSYFLDLFAGDWITSPSHVASWMS